MEPATRARVASRTLASALIPRETVMGETPAWRATSWIVTFLPPRRPALRVTVLSHLVFSKYHAKIKCAGRQQASGIIAVAGPQDDLMTSAPYGTTRDGHAVTLHALTN